MISIVNQTRFKAATLVHDPNESIKVLSKINVGLFWLTNAIKKKSTLAKQYKYQISKEWQEY